MSEYGLDEQNREMIADLLASINTLRKRMQALEAADKKSRETGCWCDEHGHPCEGCSLRRRLRALEEAARFVVSRTTAEETLDACERLAEVLQTKPTQLTTVHTYTCGCRSNEYASDGRPEETHGHPCPNHGGHI